MLNDPKMFEKMCKNKQSVLLKWINENISPINSFSNISSYRLKHLFEESINGFYVTNGEFKGAMLRAGYKIKNLTDTNWRFNISKKSKCLRRSNK